MLVGGLGLGFTLDRVLGDRRVEQCVMVEIEPALVDWMRDGTIPHGPRLLADSRVRLVVGDVARALAEAAPASYDVVLLDVDNGPDHLVHDTNADLYAAPFLREVHDRLAPGGAVALWSAGRSPALLDALAEVFGQVDERSTRCGSRTATSTTGSTPAAARPPIRWPTSLGSMTPQETRTEHDSMGEVEVPVDALWRAQTQRAVDNFPISGRPLPAALIHALARIKAAAARANADLGVITPEQRDAIVTAVAAIVDGRHDDQFPIDVFQTGSGTSTNMNVNEVISSLASRAGVECHPNDVVNASQSSNDTFPSAIHVAAVLEAADLHHATALLHDALTRKSEEYRQAVKSGRTHLMDATPVTLGQELGGYARTVSLARSRVESTLPRVRELALGGTAVGTGINTPRGFAADRRRPPRRRHRRDLHRGREPLRGAGHPGLPGRAQRRAQDLRRRSGEDLQRPALDGLGPDGRAGRDPPPGPPAGLQHHARQGQPRDPRGHAPGLCAGDRQRHGDHLRRRQPAASSST